MFIFTVEVLLLVYLFDTNVLETPLVNWIRNQSIVFVVCKSRFCVVCCDMFLSTGSVLLLIVYFFDTIVIEDPSVRWLRNISIVFVFC